MKYNIKMNDYIDIEMLMISIHNVNMYVKQKLVDIIKNMSNEHSHKYILKPKSFFHYISFPELCISV